MTLLDVVCCRDYLQAGGSVRIALYLTRPLLVAGQSKLACQPPFPSAIFNNNSHLLPPNNKPTSHWQVIALKMSKPVKIESPAQFSELLKTSKIVVADCELLPSFHQVAAPPCRG